MQTRSGSAIESSAIPLASGRLGKIQGWLTVVLCPDPAPAELCKPGTVLDLEVGEIVRQAVVLPVGSNHRIFLRVAEGCGGLSSGQDAVLRPGGEAVEALYAGSAEQSVRYLQAPAADPVDFTVVTLLRDEAKYRRMLASYHDFGFTPENTEFIALDNRDENRFDGYRGARTALQEARGTYVIFCHDDIELLQDRRETLLERLAALEATDPRWMVAGVAGGLHHSDTLKKRVASRISDPWGAGRSVLGPFPRRVESLDECFLLMPRRRAPQSSVDLDGFHFFGTDLCLQAELAGGSAYVINFHVFHHGKARKRGDYWALQRAMVAKYERYFPWRSVTTSTKPLYLEQAEAEYPLLRDADTSKTGTGSSQEAEADRD